IRGNTVGTQGVLSSGSKNGRGIQVQNEGSVSVTVEISGNIVQQINTTGNQGINFQHGIAVPGAVGASNGIITNNIVRNITSGSRPINVEILNTGTLCADISGNTFPGSTGQGGGASLLRVNESAPGGGTMTVRQKTPTAAADPQELDDA